MVLMHGGPGLDHTTLLPLEPLADRFTLIFYDHRCNGRSEGAELSTMTWDNFIADVEALRQVLNFDRWAVLGQSFGGMLALEYALRHPRRISHLILMDSGADIRWLQENAPELLAKRGYGPAAESAARRFYRGDFTPDEFLPISMKFAKAYFYRLNLKALASHGESPKVRPEAQIYAFSRLLPGWTVMDRLWEIEIPALVMAGRFDFLFPPESQAILADRLPNARLELIERAGHNPQIERPAEVIQAIERFMDTTAPVTA
jgi:proline iminopeptidase